MQAEIYPFRGPGQIIFGAGALNKLSQEVKTLGGKKVFVVTDPGVAGAGLLDRVVEMLNKDGLEVDSYSDVRPEPPVSSLSSCAAMVRENRYDVIVGLGGGSAIDVAKGVSVLSANPGVISDYFGIEQVPVRGLPLIALPTTSGTGAEVTANAVYVEEFKKVKMTVQSRFIIPDTAIVDPELTLSCPAGLTAATGLDALAHAIESYTAQKATPITEMYALEAIRQISVNLRKATYDGKNLEARTGMSLGSLLAGVTLANAGINAVHAMAHSLGGRFGVSHGVSNGMLLPYVMEYNMVSDLKKFSDIAQAMGENVAGLTPREAASKAVESVMNLCVDVNIPLKMSSIIPGFSREQVLEMIPGVMSNIRSMSNNPRVLTAQDVEAIYMNAL
ncbi:MAG: iron-containing alcohol dehydrogenase [Desulfocucumaceae bacterium]